MRGKLYNPIYIGNTQNDLNKITGKFFQNEAKKYITTGKLTPLQPIFLNIKKIQDNVAK